MAKYNLLLGTGSGSVGDVTFYRYAGKQCSRVRVREINNPQSEAQMIQRSIAATVTKAYSALSEICNHSFEGIQYRAKSMNYFNKVNMDTIRGLYQTYFDENTYKLSIVSPKTFTIVPNTYLISKGSLEQNIILSSNDTQSCAINISVDSAASSETKDDEMLLTNMGLLEPYSIQTWVAIFMDMETPLYDMGSGDGSVVYDSSVQYVRAIRNSVEYDGEATSDVNEFVSKYFTIESDWQQTWVESLITAATGSTGSITLPDPGEKLLACYGIIRSVRDDKIWKRSTCKLTLHDEVLSSNSPGLSPLYAKSAWMDTDSLLGSSDYILNQ